MLYNPPSGSTDPNAPYIRKNVAAGTQGSKVPPEAVEYTQREIVALEAAAGLSPTNTVLVQAAQALGRGIWVGALTGTGDLAVATLGVVLPALIQGMRIGAVAAAANTSTAPKLRVVNLGSASAYTDFPILKADGSALAVGDIKAGRLYRYEADGSGNVLISGGGISTAAATDTGAVLSTLRALQNVQQFRTSTRVLLSGTATPVVAWTPTSPSGVSTYTKKSATSSLLTMLVMVNFAGGSSPRGADAITLGIGSFTRQYIGATGQASILAIAQLPKIDIITAADLGNPAAGTALSLAVKMFCPDGSSWALSFCPTSTDSAYIPASTTSILIIGEIEPTA